MRFPLWLTIAILLPLATSGCAGLQLQLHNASVQKPSNVALYFSIETRAGDPVPDLPAEAFRIYEDDQLISPFESQQTILNPEMAVIHFIVLLLDLSGSITESGSLPAVIEAAGAFAERVSRTHPVAVFGFDGAAQLVPVVPFTTSGSQVQSGLKRLLGWKVRDPSTNLNGAVVEAVGALNDKMAKATQPLRFGTLVVFTDGTDRAHRVTTEATEKALDESVANVFAIGVGAEISAKQLERLGRNGFVQAVDLATVGKAFDEVAARIEAAGRKFYLLSYCSPARAGVHDLRVEVEVESLSGGLEHRFDATGFAPHCDPRQKPAFSIGRIRLH